MTAYIIVMMERWRDGQSYGQMNVKTHRQIYGWTNELMGRWVDGHNGQSYGQKDTLVDRWMYIQTK